MPQLNPLTITLALLVLAIILVVILARRRQVLAGYSEIRRDVLRLSKMLGAEPFREGNDLVLPGNYEKRPVQVRFSNSDDSPALSVVMAVPATFQLSVVPRSATSRKKGRFVLRTDDPFLDSAFISSSDQPTQARLFVDNREVKQILKALGRSSAVFLEVVPGLMTVNEPTLSSPHPAEVIVGYLGNMARLAEKFLAMPGASSIKIEPYRKPGSLLARATVGVALVIALVAALRLNLAGSAETLPTSVPVAPAGISSTDAAAIPGLKEWRLVQETDFDPDLVRWLRDPGIAPAGRIPGAFSGKNNGRDVAYILTNPTGLVRIVVISQRNPVSHFPPPHLPIPPPS